jgi:hypothetical protein
MTVPNLTLEQALVLYNSTDIEVRNQATVVLAAHQRRMYEQDQRESDLAKQIKTNTSQSPDQSKVIQPAAKSPVETSLSSLIDTGA